MERFRKKPKLDRKTERAVAAQLGKHVPPEAGIILLAFTTAACAAPVLLGLRLWNEIPLAMETGLVNFSGEPDLLPRWALVFLVPGLFLALNAINHLQLRKFQRQEKVPPRHTLFMGRWGFPIIGLAVCSWLIPNAAGRENMIIPADAAWLLGLGVMFYGGKLLVENRPMKNTALLILSAGLLAVCGASVFLPLM